MSTLSRRVFLSAQWRYLLMLNYEVPVEALLPWVPKGVTLDLWQDRAIVSVVGFRFLGTQVLGIGFPWHHNFDEVNLRFYVRRLMPDGEIRRGVTFVRELVPRMMIARIAKLAYNEPYRACPMRSEVPRESIDSPGRVLFNWRIANDWHHVAGTAVGPPHTQAPGDESAFITEHHWGYTRKRNGSTVEYQVEHPSWRVWDIASPELSPGVPAFYGPPFEASLSSPPRSAFLAEGSAVRVYKPTVLS